MKRRFIRLQPRKNMKKFRSHTHTQKKAEPKNKTSETKRTKIKVDPFSTSILRPVKFSRCVVRLSSLQSTEGGQEKIKVISLEVLKQSRSVFSLVDDLVDGGLLVTGSCHDVFVICWDVTAQDGGRLLRLWKHKRQKSIKVSFLMSSSWSKHDN